MYRPSRILLVTSSLGFGHVRASQAINQALVKAMPEARVETLDFWSLMDSRVAYAVRCTYLQLVCDDPSLYERVYHLEQGTWRAIVESSGALPTELTAIARLLPRRLVEDTAGMLNGSYPTDRTLLMLLRRVLIKRPSTTSNGAARLMLVREVWNRLLKRMVAKVRSVAPDVVIATQMLPAALVAGLRTRAGLRIPTIGVLTDYGLHDFWIQDGIDLLCLGHASFADLSARGVAPERVHVTGLPLMDGFSRLPDAHTARLLLGLDPYRPVVMVAGGGLGLGVMAVVERLLAGNTSRQLLVSVGHNEAVASALNSLSRDYPSALRVVGWTDHAEYLYRAADIVVGKAGGLTVAEALACGRPLVIAQMLGGQEGFNVRFLEAHRVGISASIDNLSRVIDRLFENPGALTAMQVRAGSLGTAFGAERIAELVAASLADGSRLQRLEAAG
jgi:UDP-N-acetylglucosamine:LPS N-acetylglucosamine transferase